MAIEDILSGFNAGAARVALTGAVRIAPVGTEIKPITEKYDPELFTNLGYLSPDGVEISFDEDKQEYIPWQEAAAIRTDITKATKSIKFTMWETSPEKIALFLGVPVDKIEDIEEGGVTAFWEEGLPQFEITQLHVDMVDGDKHNRVSFPSAKVTERGALVLKKDDIFSLEVTYTTFPGGAEYEGTPARGKTAYWQFNKAFAEAADISTSVDGVRPLEVFTASLPRGTVGEAYTAKLAATGGTAPYSWEVSEGSLPAGLELDGEGNITGTPTSAASEMVTFKVTDAKKLPASEMITVTVRAAEE
ncbi:MULTISPECIES: Ig domain-containing protein [Corynebacterium]|uniref:Ig domain-containing protein n=1 Tax=Corynebacterium TaxID=1716 RepID=UPI00124DB92E|nr:MULTISPECIES: Ig domain-containing protein [Corynebacterium]